MLLSKCILPKDLQRKDGSLRSDEITAAETFWIKQAQVQAFLDGENEGSLIRLNLKRDGDGLPRMDGRLRFADYLLYDTKESHSPAKESPRDKATCH